MKKRNKIRLTDEFATREKLELYQQLFTSLPDPDKILEENGYDYSIYRNLLTDPHLAAAIQQRKMQVIQMGWEIVNDCEEELNKDAMKIMRELSLGKIINQMLDAIFFGFAVGEIRWEYEGKKIYPRDIAGKPQEWFIYDRKNKLRLRRPGFVPLYGTTPGQAEELPAYKFIISQYQPTYSNPYGEKILARCYWPITFKRAGIEAWQLLMEKFGTPYLIGRYKSTATEGEKEALLYELLQMIEDNVTIAEEGQEIEIVEQVKYEIGQLYEKVTEFHNKEISKAVLTVTLTTDIGKTGSYKAADIHREMFEYLGVSDKKIVEAGLNEMFRYFTDLNYGPKTESPRVKLHKKEKVIEESAERDKILSEMGIKFSKEYFMRKYNLEEGDFELSEPNS